MLELSYPRNSIVKIILSKGDKPTVAGSKKLLPDMHSFVQVLRSGPTSVQVKNISDGTVRTIKKSSVSLVTFSENQRAVQLMKDNFPRSLLWGHNQYHRKQAMSKYVYHSRHRPTDKKVKHVTFCENSHILYKSELIDIEEQFLSLYYDFSVFPAF